MLPRQRVQMLVDGGRGHALSPHSRQPLAAHPWAHWQINGASGPLRAVARSATYPSSCINPPNSPASAFHATLDRRPGSPILPRSRAPVLRLSKSLRVLTPKTAREAGKEGLFVLWVVLQATSLEVAVEGLVPSKPKPPLSGISAVKSRVSIELGPIRASRALAVLPRPGIGQRAL